jgi:hypothetical protein
VFEVELAVESFDPQAIVKNRTPNKTRKIKNQLQSLRRSQ